MIFIWILRQIPLSMAQAIVKTNNDPVNLFMYPPLVQ